MIFCDRRYLAIWWWRNQCWFDSLKSKGFCFEHESGWCMLNFKYPFLFWAISKLIPIFCKDKLSISNLMSSFTRSHYCQQLPDQKNVTDCLYLEIIWAVYNLLMQQELFLNRVYFISYNFCYWAGNNDLVHSKIKDVPLQYFPLWVIEVIM